MRARFMARMMSLFVILSALARAQVVLTDDANTSSFSAKTSLFLFKLFLMRFRRAGLALATLIR